MVTLDEVAQWALALPGIAESERHGHRSWSVGKKGVAWERPLTKADMKRWDAGSLPQGDVVAVVVEDMGHKAAVMADPPKGFFDMQHFAGYPAVLVELRLAGKRAVRAALEEAWLSVTPPAEARAYLATKSARRAAPP